MKIELIGKSLKGKNKVRELGNIWIVLKEQEKVGFSNLSGRWCLIVPEQFKEESFNCPHIRWINIFGDLDKDFSWKVPLGSKPNRIEVRGK